MAYLRRSAVWSDPRIKPLAGQAILEPTHRLAIALRGAWLINEQGGLWVRDYANSYHGRVTNAGGLRKPFAGTNAPGWKNDGVTNAQIRPAPALGMGGNVGYSIVGRWRPLESGAAGHRLFAWGVATTRNMVILGRNTSTRTGQFWFSDDQTADNGSPAEDNTNRINQIAAVYDRPNNARTLFYQGRRIAGPTAPGGTPNFTDANYTIGDFSNAQVNSLAWIDFVYLWRERALTASEIQWLYEEPFIMFKPVVRRRVFDPGPPTAVPIVYPSIRKTEQPPANFVVHGDGGLRQEMVGAWSFSTPGARLHNHAPKLSGVLIDTAVAHAVIKNWETGTWRLQDGARTFSTPASGPQASVAWVDLSNPIVDTDDVTVLVGWVPFQLAAPPEGGMFGRGMDGFGSGWNIYLRHDASDQIGCAAVLAGGQVTANQTAAGLKVGKMNYAAGRIRQGVNVSVCVNGRPPVVTATASTGLRASTKGCGIGVSAASGNTSRVDGMAFCFLWKRALNDAEMMEITSKPWVLWSETEQRPGFVGATKLAELVIPLPLEAGQSERRLIIDLPLEAIQPGRELIIPLHLEASGTLRMALDLPLESGGEPEGSLGHIFDIFRSGEPHLTHFFDIVEAQPDTNPILHTFDIVEGGNALFHTFDIFRDTLMNMRKSDDVQRPIADVQIVTGT